MCGIFGYIGTQQDGMETALRALQNISYRGYDSYGFAYDQNGDIVVKKDKGDVSDVVFPSISSRKVIAHTRWATHGKPCKKNAHPHTYKGIFIVHNGTIDNYEELKQLACIRDDVFTSDTDSEVIAHLMHHFSKSLDFLEALRQTCLLIKGTYAIIAMNCHDNHLVFAKKGSPLIIGIDRRGGFYICSDILGFPRKHVEQIVYLENNQLGYVNAISRFIDMDGNPIARNKVLLPAYDASVADKGDFQHFMQKEIYEQREILRTLPFDTLFQIRVLANKILQHKYVVFTGCGTAFNVALSAKQIFYSFDRTHKRVYFAETPSHLGYTTPDTPDTLVISISQSGETADLISGMEQLKHCHLAAILNTPHSTLDRMVDNVILTNCGPEKAVASTKATSAQLACAFLLAHHAFANIYDAQKEIVNISSYMSDLLNPKYETYVRKVADKLCGARHIFVVGKKTNHPIALEASIKLAEVTYIHAQAFDSAEFKHGPFALIDEDEKTPVIALMGDPEHDDEYDIMLTQLEEMKSKGAHIIGIGPKRCSVFDLWLHVPPCGIYAPLVNLIPIQLLSYHIGLARQRPIDKPRNLAKSVTTR